MGYSIAWVAVQTTDQASLFQLAQVRRTDDADRYFEAPISGTALNGGWFLLVGQGCDHRLIDRNLLASVSYRWPCVACSIEEHVMFSSASLWRGGAEVWFASHDAQKGIFDLADSGQLPNSYRQLRQSKIQEQQAEGGQSADVDVMFDVPLLLARELTGFKHDEEPTCLAEPTPVAFIDERQAIKRRRPWWKLS